MDTLVTVLLIVHILGAIVAFGPTFTFPLVSRLAREDPPHSVFGIQLVETISRRIVTPAGIVMALAGVGLILAAEWDLFANPWLWVSILLYVAAVVLATRVQAPRVATALELMQRPPAEGREGPPPELAALGKQIAMAGGILHALTITIAVLMIWKPGAS